MAIGSHVLILRSNQSSPENYEVEKIYGNYVADGRRQHRGLTRPLTPHRRPVHKQESAS